MEEIQKVLKEGHYIDLAKLITSTLHNECVESKNEYTFTDLNIGCALGVLAFLKTIIEDEEKFTMTVKDYVKWIHICKNKLDKMQ